MEANSIDGAVPTPFNSITASLLRLATVFNTHHTAPVPAAVSSTLRHLPLRAAWGNEEGDGGKKAGKKRRRKVPLPAELLEEQQQNQPAQAQEEKKPAAAAAPARSREEELAERLKQDIARFKAVEQAEGKESEASEGEASGLAGLGQKAASAFEKVLVADFFVVLAFLGWFIAGVVFKSVFDDRSVLDGFNAIWTPVIQPALGMCVRLMVWLIWIRARSTHTIT